MTLSLFEGFGVELEYMIVDRKTLNVLPMSDKLLERVAGKIVSELERGKMGWSNELAMHVIEFKVVNPASSLTGLAQAFQEEVRAANHLLAPFGACLMPTAMHPWMDPYKELKLWPHEQNRIYEAFNRIFDCRGHGWANLQSAHINLPFANDEEFAKLHAAIRVLLPIMPALSASSPFMDGKLTGTLDNRLQVYAKNSAVIPSITGKVVPEAATSEEEYERTILQPIYQDIAPYDPEGILQDEWLNARGAIARFDRNAIEIRVLDIQECPAADIAIAKAIVSVLQRLITVPVKELNALDLGTLQALFFSCVKNGEEAVIQDPQYLAVFGSPSCTVGELWRSLVGPLKPPLARRIQHAWQKNPTHENLFSIYKELCACLAEGRLFDHV